MKLEPLLDSSCSNGRESILGLMLRSPEKIGAILGCYGWAYRRLETEAIASYTWFKAEPPLYWSHLNGC
jgi:putative AlgH/UPF0301 family transcriptional regulator